MRPLVASSLFRLSCRGRRRRPRPQPQPQPQPQPRPAAVRCFAQGGPADASLRDSRYAQVHSDDLLAFRRIVGDRPGGVVTDTETLRGMNRDWLGKWQGQARVALRPKGTSEVAAILRHCNERRIAVCPQGGNTGLVGGGIPVFDEVILSLGAMDEIIDFDEVSGVVTVEAGCVLAQVESYLEARGFTMPLDLGAKGSCMIGGNVSTNAGGLRYIRYGSLHGTVLGLEAVLADGTVLDTLTTMRKDNTGYDLKQLFIGGEGTLGVITKVALLAPPRPSSVNTAFFGVGDFERVRATFTEAKRHMGEIVSAVEFVDRQGLEHVLAMNPGARDPLPERRHPFYVLIETSGSNLEHDVEKLNMFLDKVMGDEVVQGGVVAQDEKQSKALFALREGVAIAMSAQGCVYKYDISLPIAEMYSVVEEARERLPVDRRDVVGYGHLGDSNLHLNVLCREGHDEAVLQKLEPYIFERTSAMRGSISAEHGIGQCKPEHLHLSKPPEVISMMRAIKQLFDPNGILNPYKMLPREN